MKKCRDCNQTKIFDEFYVAKGNTDGYTNICIVCEKRRNRERYARNKETWLRPKRLYQQTDRYKDLKRQRTNKFRLENPEKQKAMDDLNYAVRSGRMKKLLCEVCGEQKVQGHHNWGYEGENALRVMWLCDTHHKAQHRKMKSEDL